MNIMNDQLATAANSSEVGDVYVRIVVCGLVVRFVRFVHCFGWRISDLIDDFENCQANALDCVLLLLFLPPLMLCYEINMPRK